jgi:tyrosinase
MFDGSESSMGGNGAPSEYPGIAQPFPRPYDKMPSAGGGGCVTEGPFKESVLSPSSLSLSSPSLFSPLLEGVGN